MGKKNYCVYIMRIIDFHHTEYINLGLCIMLIINLIIFKYENNLIIEENNRLRKKIKDYKRYKSKIIKTVNILDNELKVINNRLKKTIQTPIISTIDFSTIQ